MIKEITDKLGLPIIDDEIVELCKKKIHKRKIRIVVKAILFSDIYIHVTCIIYIKEKDYETLY